MRVFRTLLSKGLCADETEELEGDGDGDIDGMKVMVNFFGSYSLLFTSVDGERSHLFYSSTAHECSDEVGDIFPDCNYTCSHLVSRYSYTCPTCPSSGCSDFMSSRTNTIFTSLKCVFVNMLQFDDDVEGTGMGEGEGKKDVTDQIEDEEQLLGLKGDEPDKDHAEEAKELGACVSIVG